MIKNIAKCCCTCMLVTLLLASNVSAHTDEEIIHRMDTEGIMIGTDKGFEPNKELTRAEMAAIIVRMEKLDDDNTVTKSYTDVNEEHWAFKYINIATREGLLKGTGDNEFSPNKMLTTAELVTIVVRSIADTSEIENKGTWPDNYMEYAKSQNLLDGINKDKNENATRIETARIMVNALDALKVDPEEDKKEDEKNEGNGISVAGSGVVLSICDSLDDMQEIEVVTPAGIKTYKAHKSENQNDSIYEGVFITYWLSGDTLWDIDTTNMDTSAGSYAINNVAKIFNIGDGVLKVLKPNNDVEYLDANLILFMSCESMDTTSGKRKFENLKVGKESDIDFCYSEDDDYDESEGTEVFYHTIKIDDTERVVSVIYVEN